MATKRAGMSKRVRRELRKLRELARVLLDGKVCCFCGGPLVDNSGFAAGNADGAPLRGLPCVHHLNGVHEDDRPENRGLAHVKCHKAHHAKERAAKR
jgi:hypothetical protein